ncbi:F-Box Protein92 [Hibiscus trionum]|uniref:F-Box Protein92 n=1 Tax=Hibiscus trionum TaxID=183268 RepID=A0A9W7GW23_HIBTR|nr:F-Box Protein92 [Hibiscus trionum]
MDRLPQELVLDILSRLPTPSLVQSKSVSRGWRILIRDKALINKHFNRLVDKDPTFILQIRDQPAQNQLYFGDLSCHGNLMIITKKLTMPPLPTFHLVSSCNGLLCFRGTHRSFGLICVYNPFTRDYIELPKLIAEHPSHHVGVLGFGFDASTEKYKVVEVLYKGITRRSSSSIESAVHILSVGSPTWRNLGSFPFHFMWQKSQILVHGKLHWISYPDKNNATNLIMSFDLANEQFLEVPLPDCMISWDRQFHELVVLRGCLSAVSFEDDNEELEIWVMKEYGVRESWVKEFSIGAYVSRLLQPNDEHESLNSSMYYSPKICMRVLSLLTSGGILLEYRSKAVVVYDPHCKKFQDLHLTFEGIPRCFRAVVHVASLNWIDT